MTIFSNDIKIYQAQDNTDNDSGGGSRTAIEIVDANVNNLFPDISRIDTVLGDVALRKVFPTVVTTNRDVYYGAHAMIRKAPTDANVSALLFHTGDPHDKRLAAQDKIESYVIASYQEEFYLFGNHIAGAKSVTFLQRTTSAPPIVGEVYMLRQPDLSEQYIRISSADVKDIILSANVGGTLTDYTRRRIICEIDQPLDIPFTGSAFDPVGQQANTADTFATQVANASKFYGVKELSLAATTGDQVITVDSIFEQIVPASITQTPLVNANSVLDGISLVPTGEIFTGVPCNLNAVGSVTTMPSPIVPASMTQVFSNLYADNGLGQVIKISSGEVFANVNYKNGTISAVKVFGAGGTANYEIANVVQSAIQFTSGIKITQGNQNLVYVKNLSPLPSITDLYVDYRSSGKWYKITANADGTLGQDPNIGAGSIADNGDGTGTVSLTLGALPDIDSTIIFSWSSAERFTQHKESKIINAQTTTIPDVATRYIRVVLDHTDIDPLTFVMQLYDTVVAALVNITSDVEGVLIDAADSSRKIQGRLDFLNGIVYIDNTKLSGRFPDLGSVVQNIVINYDQLTTIPSDPHEIINKVGSKTPIAGQVLVTETTGTGTITFNLGETITDLASVRVSLSALPSLGRIWLGFSEGFLSRKITILLGSTAAGVLYQMGGTGYGSIVGTVATNGDVSITLINVDHIIDNPIYAGSFGNIPKYLKVVDSYYTIANYDLSFQYRVDAPLGGVTRTPFAMNDTAENLLKYVINTTGGISGDLYFNFLTKSTTDLTFLLSSKAAESNVYHEFNSTTGVGIQIGTIDKNKGEIVLDYFQKPDNLFLNFIALFTDEVNTIEYETGKYTAPFDNVVFRTASTKISPSSFQLRYESENGIQSATTDANGVITGVDIDSGTSYVDTVTGMVSIDFTAEVLAQSLKYDAVAESSLPLDPVLLGLNPVRLPVDGRVPVFVAGGLVVVFNEISTPVVNGTPIADQVDTLSRSGQAFIEVIDSEGRRLNQAAYVADKNLGTVTFANPLVLEDKYAVALVAPYTIVDRIEDMLLATEVQINGLITLAAPLAHDHPANTTRVASALVFGDTGSRVFNYFAQEIWDSGNPVWSDQLIGDPTTAQFDEINYPIQIDNKSSTSGRWAIIFKSTTSVDVVEEKLGVVESGVSISIDDVSPINPATGEPYFTMDRNGFGSGWVANNVVRINTDSGDNNMWVIRTVKSGALVESLDSIELEIRGDAN
jgi:hypothetical protein